MNRLFGKSKPKVPAPTLEDASKSMSDRGGVVDEKMKKLDEELLRYKQQMSKMKAGPAKTQVQQRALRCLQQKKMYQKQRDTLYNQQFNIDQTQFAQQNVKDTITTVAAMKDASKGLKVEMKKVKVDEIEDLHDDMTDMLEDTDEINEIMGRAYGVPEDVDETDLMDELNALEGEMESESVGESNEIPSYLVNAATATTNNNSIQQSNQRQEKKQNEVDVDEFGLPSVPVRSLEV